MDESLIRVLTVDNPWLRGEPLEPWFARHLPEVYVPRRLRLQAGHRAVLVVGPRQAGKSTLIWKTLEERGTPALFLDCEEPAVRTWLTSPASFLADLQGLASEVPALFFEEIQFLPEAGLFLKGLVDRRTGLEVYATGSSSFELESATRESLAGRARRHRLLPLSIGEIASTIAGAPAARQLALGEAVERMLGFGSYPAVHTSSHPEQELAGLVEAFVVRDASDRFRLRHVAALRKILELAASQIGNLCNFTEWAELAGVSHGTVVDYCRLLEDTHILKLVRPFVGGKRAEIVKAPKVFFLDNGIRNQLYGGFGPWSGRVDRGPLLENLVFTELSKGLNPLLDSLHYWRSKSGAEVDFVIRHRERLVGCEVKAGDARGNVSRSARSLIAAYQPERFWIVNREPYETVELGKTPVEFLRVGEIDRVLAEFLSE